MSLSIIIHFFLGIVGTVREYLEKAGTNKFDPGREIGTVK